MAIPEKIAELIGPIGEPQIWEVERGAIKRFADAIDDPNPLYHDVEYAKNGKYGEMIAPVGFFGWPIKGAFMENMGSIIGPIVDAGYLVIVDGGIEYEPFFPIRAGDILSSYGKITDISEKTTKSGKGMLMPTMEINFLNQNGDKVLAVRWSFICRQL